MTQPATGESLLEAIEQKPFDPHLRLIYADWLNEWGDGEMEHHQRCMASYLDGFTYLNCCNRHKENVLAYCGLKDLLVYILPSRDSPFLCGRRPRDENIYHISHGSGALDRWQELPYVRRGRRLCVVVGIKWLIAEGFLC